MGFTQLRFNSHDNLISAENTHARCYLFSFSFFLQQIEFEWVLHVEVHSVLKNLHTLLVVSIISYLSFVSIFGVLEIVYTPVSNGLPFSFDLSSS